jgi:DNA-binding FadR family transcriptional regulator
VEKIKRVSVAEEIVNRILEMVEDGTLTPGEALPTEKEFTEMFGVGRSSVREALRALQSVGLVEKRQGNGTYLTAAAGKSSALFNVQKILERYTLVELSEARKILEEQITALSAKNATRENIQTMRRENARLAALMESGSPEEIIACDQAVHRAIADGAHNEFLTEMLEMLAEIYMEANISVLTRDKTESAVAFHNKIIDFIEAGDLKNARRTMTEHLVDVHNRIIELYDDAQTEQR